MKTGERRCPRCRTVARPVERFADGCPTCPGCAFAFPEEPRQRPPVASRALDARPDPRRHGPV